MGVSLKHRKCPENYAKASVHRSECAQLSAKVCRENRSLGASEAMTAKSGDLLIRPKKFSLQAARTTGRVVAVRREVLPPCSGKDSASTRSVILALPVWALCRPRMQRSIGHSWCSPERKDGPKRSLVRVLRCCERSPLSRHSPRVRNQATRGLTVCGTKLPNGIELCSVLMRRSCPESRRLPRIRSRQVRSRPEPGPSLPTLELCRFRRSETGRSCQG